MLHYSYALQLRPYILSWSMTEAQKHSLQCYEDLCQDVAHVQIYIVIMEWISLGVNNKLRTFYKILQECEFQSKMVQCAANEGIHWQFIPPNSPPLEVFGKLEECLMKFHLWQIAKKLVLTFKDLITILMLIEACSNSRPISQLSFNPSDPQALTPGHFLIGTPLTSLHDPHLTYIPVNRFNRWQLVQQLWHRWSTNHLSQFQQCPKWCSHHQMLVLIKEDNVLPLLWKLAAVKEVYHGPDDSVHIETVRSSSGVYKRAISKLCLLPNNVDVE